jgi:hypothetical protein
MFILAEFNSVLLLLWGQQGREAAKHTVTGVNLVQSPITDFGFLRLFGHLLEMAEINLN